MAVQGVFSLASGKANNVAPVASSSVQKRSAACETTSSGADQEEFE
jgi:hypothetical protein